MKKLGSTAVALCAAGTLAFSAAPSQAADNRAGDSLVNVQVGDVLIQAPIAVAANLCDIAVNVLARSASLGDTQCTADAESVASPGTGDGGGGNRAGDSLVNVQIGDITAQLPIAVAANVCDVAVNVLAAHLRAGETTCEAVATSTA